MAENAPGHCCLRARSLNDIIYFSDLTQVNRSITLSLLL